MIDLLPTIAAELAADAGVAAIAGIRVRADEPDAGDVAVPFVAFVVLVDFGYFRPEASVPVQYRRTLAKCYGRTAAESQQLRNAVVSAWNLAGPRVAAGVGIYESYDETDSGPADRDPDTRQPYCEALLSALASTETVS